MKFASPNQKQNPDLGTESGATSSKTLEMRKRTTEITTCFFVALVTFGNIEEEEQMEYTRKPKLLQIVQQSNNNNQLYFSRVALDGIKY